MPMKPHKDETQSEFMARCVPEMIGTGDDKRPQEQAVAACLNIWREEHKEQRQVPQPDPDEDREEFIDRCVSEMLDDDQSLDVSDVEGQCETAWEERQAPPVVRKTHAETVNGMEFILSDETPDRMGDIISAAGWELDNFKRNPIALFGHRSDFPIGRWHNLRTEGTALRGRLELAPAGTSARIDEIRRLVEVGILKAVSVGFAPIDQEPIDAKDPWGGQRFNRQELVETSLVSVPANPNALAVAKSLGISDDTIAVAFAKSGSRSERRTDRRLTGKAAEISRRQKSNAMSFAQRITDSEARINALRDKLTEHLKNQDDSNVTDAELETTRELTAKITQEEKSRDALKEAERHVALSSDDNSRRIQLPAAPAAPARPFNMPAKKLDPVELIIRAGVIGAFSHKYKKSTDETRAVLAQVYPAYGDDMTKAFVDYVERAATAPAMTTVTGWAAELATTVYANFMETLMPKSVFPRLSAMGLSLSFGRAGRISIPTRARTPTVAGSFVGEGAPIPVRQGQFTAQILTPKKMAVITQWTREMDEHSVPAIEGLLRQAVQEDTAVSLDSVLIDANAATTVRPAGILNGVAALTATTGGGFNALVGDIKQLTGALITGTTGHLRSPAWLMNPQQVNSAGLIVGPNSGVFPFRDEVRAGQLQSYPIIDSGTVPLATVILIDAADFVVAGGDAPRFEVSDQATLHEEDTTPLPIGTAGTPAVVAAPVRSLWQTDSMALRLILPINWTLRRTGVVAWVAGVTW